MIKINDRKIIIEIDEKGRIIADAEGFKGPVCIETIKELLKDLQPIKDIDKKPDFYAKDRVIHKTHTKDKITLG